MEFTPLDQTFMQQAFRQAELAYSHDEVPIGAVIVHDNKIIAKAYNQVETLRDPTAHAEIIAITQAVNTLSAKWLYDCTMYVTLEPCAMCAGALVLSRMKKIIIGTPDEKIGACGSLLNIVQNDKLNHRLEIQTGLMQQECCQILKDFFKQKRHLLN